MIPTSYIPYILERAIKPTVDDDIVDHINSRVVPCILIACGLLVGMYALGNTTIDVLPKANWPPMWGRYAENYCVVEGTYYIPMNESLPKHHRLDHYQKLVYYRSASFNYVLFGVLFPIARCYWSFIISISCFHVKRIMKESIKDREDSGMPTREFLSSFSHHILNALKRKHSHKKSANFCMRIWSKHIGTRVLTFNYFLMKIGYTTVLIVMLFVFPILIAEKRNDDTPITVITTLLMGVGWNVSGLFPLKTTCFFPIRELGIDGKTEISLKSVQVELLVNPINEMSYICVWSGLVVLLFVNIFYFLWWLILFYRPLRTRYLSKMIQAYADVAYPSFGPYGSFRIQIREWEETVDTKMNILANARRQGDLDWIDVATREAQETQDEMQRWLQSSTDKQIQKREKVIAAVDSHIDDFIEFLGADGYLIIRFLEINAGEMVAGGAVARLFGKWIQYYETTHPPTDSGDVIPPN